MLAACSSGSRERDQSRGVWVGGMKLCRDTVVSAAVSSNQQDGNAIVKIGLKEDAARRLTELTRGMVGGELEIRVNGKVVSKPVVAEPIAGSTIDIVGPAGGEVADVINLAKGPC